MNKTSKHPLSFCQKITDITYLSSPPPQRNVQINRCPLRALRDSIRSYCALDVMTKCPSPASEFSFFISQPQMMTSMGMGSFDNLESMIDEMFSSTLQLFDQAMNTSRQVAEDRAVEAFDAKLPTFVDEIVSSTSVSPLSSSSNDEGEEDIDNTPPQEVVMPNLLDDIMDITRNIQMDSQRRRLSEGVVDLHVEMKGRLARRLTDYFSKTEVLQLPSGDLMRVVSVLPLEQTPRLGLGEVDECLYSQYKNGDLSCGCSTAVSSYLDFVDVHRFGVPQGLQVGHPVVTKENVIRGGAFSVLHENDASSNNESFLQTLSGKHEKFVNDHYLAYASAVFLVLAVTVNLVVLCRLAVWNTWFFISGLAVIVAGVFFGRVVMLVVLAATVLVDEFNPKDDEEVKKEDDEGPDEFDYVNMHEEDDHVNNRMSKPGESHRVFIGVPVQVV